MELLETNSLHIIKHTKLLIAVDASVCNDNIICRCEIVNSLDAVTLIRTLCGHCYTYLILSYRFRVDLFFINFDI